MVPLAITLGLGAFLVGVSVVGGDEDRRSYRRALTGSLWPLLDANHELSLALDELPYATEPRSRDAAEREAAAIEKALQRARRTTRRAADRVGSLKVPAADHPLAARVREVLGSAQSYLAAVRSALDDSSPGTGLRADCAEYRLQLRLARLAPLLPGGWKNVYGADKLLRGRRGCPL